MDFWFQERWTRDALCCNRWSYIWDWSIGSGILQFSELRFSVMCVCVIRKSWFRDLIILWITFTPHSWPLGDYCLHSTKKIDSFRDRATFGVITNPFSAGANVNRRSPRQQLGLALTCRNNSPTWLPNANTVRVRRLNRSFLFTTLFFQRKWVCRRRV